MISRELKVGDLVFLEWDRWIANWLILDVHRDPIGQIRNYTVFVIDSSHQPYSGQIKEQTVIWSGVDKCQVYSLDEKKE